MVSKIITQLNLKEYQVNWEEQITSISCVAELHPSSDHSAATSTTSITSMTWNSTGSTIAIAYGKLDHSGWCNHSGNVCVWNIFNRKMNAHQPDISLESLV